LDTHGWPGRSGAGYRQHCAQRKPPVFSLEADFEVFRPAGATRCIDGGEIFGGGDLAKLHPHRCNKGVGPQKLKFLLRFDQNVEYKRPQERIPCAIFTKFADFVPHFRKR